MAKHRIFLLLSLNEGPILVNIFNNGIDSYVSDHIRHITMFKAKKLGLGSNGSLNQQYNLFLSNCYSAFL